MSSASGTRKCYNCGLSGHMGKDCPQPPKDARAAKPAPAAAAAAEPAAAEPASSGTRKCYKCGNGGHMAKDCPSDASRSASSSSSRPETRSAPAASSGGEDKDKGPSFKERLAAYKATNPEPGKKNFCYLCGKEGHRERDCPKNSRRKDEEKLCLRCGEAGHISRICPSIANRTVYRQEEKARKVGCYICDEEGHHAEECPKLGELAEEFAKVVAKLEAGHKLHAKVYHVLLDKCARALELNGALYLWEHMRTQGITPLPASMAAMEALYDRSAKDQSKITCVPMKPKRVARLREIVQEHRHKQRQAATEEGVLPAIVAHLRLPAHRAAAEKCASLFELAKWLHQSSIAGLTEPLGNLGARRALASLKALGRYHQRNKSAEFDLDGDITTPGKFAAAKDGKDAKNAAAASSKKKKNKKRKTGATKADAKAEAVDGEEGEEQDGEKMEDVPAAASVKKEKKVKKEPAAKVKKEEAAAAAEAPPAATAGKKRKTKA